MTQHRVSAQRARRVGDDLGQCLWLGQERVVPAGEFDGPGGLGGVHALAGSRYRVIFGADHEGRRDFAPGHSAHGLPECHLGLWGSSGEGFGEGAETGPAFRRSSGF